MAEEKIMIMSPYGIPRVAQFEKVSFEEFKRAYYEIYKDGLRDENGNLPDIPETPDGNEEFMKSVTALYDGIQIPKRVSDVSPEHYFVFAFDETKLPPNTQVMIPTGIKCSITPGWEVEVHSDNIHQNLTLAGGRASRYFTNYYNNEDNEGHIILVCANYSETEECVLKPGEPYAAATFRPYGITIRDEMFEVKQPEDEQPVETATEEVEQPENVETVEAEVVE